ncbi:MAG: phosphoglucomutase/phosphomannomutase family protein [Anaerolineae bacterium]|nr:phosphoglucomutase/phosphomannomutase family protein [Anaerolineae bacterium]MDW8172178.1 phosphoglucomutase/phosphomannomutase family protein [Anaerolineae bacterium]
MIAFGTDGWRAVIAEDFTFANVRLVAQAVAEAVLRQHQGTDAPQVVVGFDTRFLSDRFAIETACVLAANGITVWLSRMDVPTPAVSYNVVDKGADAGIVITASHNPPRYNGFKLKASYGGSATAEQSRLVEGILRELEAGRSQVRLMDYQPALDAEQIRRFDPTWVYYKHLSELVDLDAISERELKVVVDSMYGAGRGALPAVLARTRTRIEEIRGNMNPGFGGIHPEPIARYLGALTSAVSRSDADLGLATDGDADRIGAVDARGQFVDPHQIFALTLQHLVEKRGLRGDVVKTISTTAMIERMCQKYGLTLHETPVGFNHIAELMMSHDVLIGGEESGGISIKGHIPEGDGVLMGLLLLEVMAHHRAPLHEIVAQLRRDFGPAYYDRHDERLHRPINKREALKRLSDSVPSHINGQAVTRVNALDGVKYLLADGGWLLIRPSGTEPVLRIYAEGPTAEDVAELLRQGAALGQALTAP